MARRNIQISTAQVEQYAALGLHVFEILACLGIDRKTWSRRCQRNPDLNDAIERGYARMAAQHAKNVLEAAMGRQASDGQGNLKVDDLKRPIWAVPPDPNWSWKWMQKHARLFKDEPQQTVMETNVTVNNLAAEQLGEDACERMARAYLKTRGKA